MRELKFRLWNKREKKMIYLPDNGENELLAIGLHGLPIAIDRSSFDRKDEITGWNVDHIYDVMQYTGLKDSNDKEIYEGDLIIFFEYSNPLEVKFGYYTPSQPWLDKDEKMYGFYFKSNRTGFEYTIKDNEESVIVGNIYENPELLKETEE